MRTQRTIHRGDPRFSSILLSWFPTVHRKAFPGATAAWMLQSAVNRTLDRA